MTTVTACHGATTASTGAKKKPVPTYQDEPARSAFMTNPATAGSGEVRVLRSDPNGPRLR